MNRLSKVQQARFNLLRGTLNTAAARAATAYEDLTARIKAAWEESDADAATTDYNEAVQAFEDFREEIASAANAYAGERSDTWQESERGETYNAWTNLWDTALEELPSDPPDVPDAPGELLDDKYPMIPEEA